MYIRQLLIIFNTAQSQKILHAAQTITKGIHWFDRATILHEPWLVYRNYWKNIQIPLTNTNHI